MIKKIFSLVVISVICIILLEIALKIFLPNLENQNETIRRFIPLHENPINTVIEMEPSDEVIELSEGLTKQVYTCETDHNGFIVNKDIPDSLNSIVFLGSSITLSYFLPDSLRFPYLIEKELYNKKPFKVYNTGTFGSNSVICLNTLLNKVLDMKPKYCVFMICAGDVAILMKNGSYFGNVGRENNIVQITTNENSLSLIKRAIIGSFSNVYNQLYLPVKSFRTEKSESQPKVEFKIVDFSKEIISKQKSFVEICKAHGIEPIIMIEPTNFHEPLDSPKYSRLNSHLENSNITIQQFMNIVDSVNQDIRIYCKKNNVKFVDLDKILDDSSHYQYDSAHLLPIGSKKVAKSFLDSFYLYERIVLQ